MAKGNWCPLIKGKCVEHKCAFYMQVMGKNPNTGEDVNQFGCAVQFLPMLLIENSQQQRQTGAAVESMRNEVVKETKESQRIAIAGIEHLSNVQQRIQPADIHLIDDKDQ